MPLAMSNFHFDITAWAGHLTGRDILAEAVALAFAGSTATCYRVTSPTFERIAEPRQSPRIEQPARLIFYWANPDTTIHTYPFPFKLDAAGAADWACRWLLEADYPKEPDHDGDNSKGWRISTVDGEFCALCSVEPAWAEHGK